MCLLFTILFAGKYDRTQECQNNTNYLLIFSFSFHYICKWCLSGFYIFSLAKKFWKYWLEWSKLLNFSRCRVFSKMVGLLFPQCHWKSFLMQSFKLSSHEDFSEDDPSNSPASSRTIFYYKGWPCSSSHYGPAISTPTAGQVSCARCCRQPRQVL